MRRERAPILPMIAILVLTSFTLSQDKAKEKEKDKPPEKVEPKYVPIAQLTGTMQAASESGMLKVRVPVRRLEPNQQVIANLPQQQQAWLRRQVEIMNNPNPVQRYQQMVQLAREVQQVRATLFVLKDTHVDIDLQTVEEMKVRNLLPQPGFDDMGNVRPLTPELLKELKGKEGLAGFKADRDDLKNGQTVYVVAGRERAVKPADAKPVAMLVVILIEPKP